jgi:hypothetical protein
VNIGTYTITATQAAHGNFSPGSPPPASFTVIAIPPTISFLLANINADALQFSLAQPQYTTSDSLGAFTFTSNNPYVASISNDNVGNPTIINLHGIQGTTSITITQAAYGNYSAGYSPTAHLVNVYIPVSIYNVTGDALTPSVLDPPQWGAAPSGQAIVFGQVNINNGDILVQATFQNNTLSYDNSKNLYLYFYTSTSFYATLDRVAIVTFPPIPNPNFPLNPYITRLNPYVFPTPLTWSYSTQSNNTFYAIWSQINPDGTGGNQSTLSMKIQNTTISTLWQWLGNLYKQT